MWKRNRFMAPLDGEGTAGGAATGATGAAGAATGTAGTATTAGTAAATGATGAGEGKAGENGETKGYWPDDWRQNYAKEDVKKLERLQRYQSPAAAIDALLAAQNRISAGELKPVLSDKATAAELTEWRAAHGIPETADKYDLKDIKVGGIDQTLLAEYLKEAHATNQTPAQVKAGLKAWGSISNTVGANRAEADTKLQKDGEDALRAEWGNDYRKNINLAHGLLDGAASPGLKDRLLSGRLADGTPIGSSPDVLKLLVGLSLIQNPSGIVVPGSEGNQAQGVEDEIGKIEKTMRTNRTAYNKDEKMQARYRDLLDARNKLKPRT